MILNTGNEGRTITVARVRAGLTIRTLAQKLYISEGTLKTWETGRVKKLPWDEIESVLPEVSEIRRNGCDKYCPSPKACLGGGRCCYKSNRGRGSNNVL